MNCNNNPQAFASVPIYNSRGAANMANPAVNTDAMATTTQDQYIQSGPWGESIVVNPNNPSSPLSVQPGGSGTPFVGSYEAAPLPETLTQNIYTPGYLNQYIGRLMRVEFLVGSQTTDRVGYLREVGASYIVLESVDYGNLMMCDLYSIKFATILREPLSPQIASLYEEQ